MLRPKKRKGYHTMTMITMICTLAGAATLAGSMMKLIERLEK